jgi:hypothetical protein
MPTTPSNLFEQAGLSIKGQAKWNTNILCNEYGLYVVAITDNANKLFCNKTIQFNDDAIENWFAIINSKGKNILIDKMSASPDQLKYRLNGFWLPDETILYIGKAEKQKLETRVGQYYDTKLGSKRKHAGGHWLNVLKNLNDLTIFYSDCDKTNIDVTEKFMLSYFMENVSAKTKTILHDKDICLPFANKELNRGLRKKHGLNNQIVDCGKNWRK